MFEKDRIFQDLRKDPVRKVMRPPNVSFASYRNLSDLWGSIHLKDGRLEQSKYMTSAEKVHASNDRVMNGQVKTLFSQRVVSLRESEVITNVYERNEGNVVEVGLGRQAKGKLNGVNVKNGQKQQDSRQRHRSILKKKMQRKVDIKKLDDFYAKVKEEFLNKKKLVHKIKGIPKVIQRDCRTYQLDTGGILTRNLFRSVRRARTKDGLGRAGHPFAGLYVQGLLPRGLAAFVLPSGQRQTTDRLFRSRLQRRLFRHHPKLHKTIRFQGHLLPRNFRKCFGRESIF